MEVVATFAGVAGAGVTFIGVFWAVVFGPRNVVDLMAARQRSGEPAKVSAQQAPKVTKGVAQQGQQPSPLGRSRHVRWRAATGRLVFHCWDEFREHDWAYDWPSLAAVAGLALRFFLFCVPVFAVLAMLFTGVGLVLESSGWLHFGLVLLVVFLTTFVGEFFLIGIMGLIAFFLAVLPDEAFKQTK